MSKRVLPFEEVSLEESRLRHRLSKRWHMRAQRSTVLVSLGSCNKIWKTGCLNITEIYCLTALEARSPKSRSQLGYVLLRPKGEPFFSSSYLPVLCQHLWHSLACTPASLYSSLFTWHSPCVSVLTQLSSYKDTSHIGYGPSPTPV